jgi:hypothetical protein
MKQKIFSTLLLLVILQAGGLQAQAQPAAFRRNVALSSSELRIDTLLKQLSRQTNIEFSFNSNKISPSRKVSLSSKKQTVEQVMQKLKQSTGVQYKLVGNHVILIDAPRKPSPVKAQAPVTAKAKAPLQGTVKKTVAATPKKAPARGEALAGTTQATPAAQIQQERIAAESAPASADSSPLQQGASVATDTLEAKAKQAPAASAEAPAAEAQAKSIGTRPEGWGFARNFRLDVGLQGLGISYMANTGRKSALELFTGLGGGYFITGQQFYYAFNPSKPSFYAAAQQKFFFREGHEGSFVGLQVKYATGSLFQRAGYDSTMGWVRFNRYVDPAFLTDVHWGIQKSLGNRWQMNGKVGIGYAFNLSGIGLNHWYPAAGLRFSYWLKRRP